MCYIIMCVVTKFKVPSGFITTHIGDAVSWKGGTFQLESINGCL